MNAKDFFSAEQKSAIQKSIADAELHTSGEIRLHIENKAGSDAVAKAKKTFDSLRMHKTKDRNGVIFLLAVKDKAFAIYGDKGIHERVHQTFWDDVKTVMGEKFHNGEFTEGLCKGIEMAGQKLKEHFPREHSDKDELSNEVSFE